MKKEQTIDNDFDYQEYNLELNDQQLEFIKVLGNKAGEVLNRIQKFFDNEVVESKEEWAQDGPWTSLEEAALNYVVERYDDNHSEPSISVQTAFIKGANWQQSQSIEGIVGFVFSDGEDKANITDLHLLSDIYDMIQNRLKSFSENTIEHLSKPLRDLLLHNGVNVDDETEF
jgi:hypothetical protein